MICSWMNERKFLSFLFCFSKEIGRLGVCAWLYLRKDERKILSTCAQKSSLKCFRQKHSLIFVYSYGLLWHYSYEQAVHTLISVVRCRLRICGTVGVKNKKCTEIRHNKSLVFNHGLERGGLFLVPFLFLLLCFILTWMVPRSWDLFRERECEVVAGALFPSTCPSFLDDSKNF